RPPVRQAVHDCVMGMVTELISALGTVVTTLIALFLLRQGQLDRREIRDQKGSDQASRVTCWCDWNLESPDVSYDNPDVAAIFVRNTSDQAIYQAFVDYYHPQTG